MGKQDRQGLNSVPVSASGRRNRAAKASALNLLDVSSPFLSLLKHGYLNVEPSDVAQMRGLLEALSQSVVRCLGEFAFFGDLGLRELACTLL